MKRAIFAGCLVTAQLLLLTAVLLQTPPTAAAVPSAGGESVTALASAPATDTPSAAAPAEAEDGIDQSAEVTVLLDNGPESMTLSEYLIGVVLAEMPSSFEPAALEAQAVAARTFTLRRLRDPKHVDADLCCHGTCCQEYRTPAELPDAAVEKVRAAVAATDGQVLLWNGQPIDAVYFSCSGGATEDAVAVWGGEVPYLRSVESPGEEFASRWSDSAEVSLEDFRAAILQQAPDAELTGQPAGWFGAVTHTAGGGVDTLEIGGVPFRGTALRSLFSLRSTKFTVSLSDDAVIFETLGYGHRVGMSQYGAQAMALAGKTYQEILTHYYTGVQLGVWGL